MKRYGIAIVNPYGGIWTDKLFESPEDADNYLSQYWGTREKYAGFKLAYAQIEVMLTLQMGEPTFIPLPA